MASLTTVYVISLVLMSMAGMGSAFVGNKINPIIGGGAKPPPTPAEVYAAARDAASKAEELANSQIPPKPSMIAPSITPKVEPSISAMPAPKATTTKKPVEEQPKEEEKSVEEQPKEEEKPVEEQPKEEEKPVEEQPKEEEKSVEVPEGDELTEKIKDKNLLDQEKVKSLVQIIKTPVDKLGSVTTDEFKNVLVDPDVKSYPANIINLYKIAALKYQNFRKFRDGEEYTPYGDQTSEAIALLSSTA